MEWLVWIGLALTFLVLVRLVPSGRGALDEAEHALRDRPEALAELRANAERARNTPPR